MVLPAFANRVAATPRNAKAMQVVLSDSIQKWLQSVSVAGGQFSGLASSLAWVCTPDSRQT